jgi:hypothetical protein
LPFPAVIGEGPKRADIIWLSELGRIDPGRGCPDLYKLAISMMDLICRYGMDRENFLPIDQFLIRAVLEPLPDSFHRGICWLSDRQPLGPESYLHGLPVGIDI